MEDSVVIHSLPVHGPAVINFRKGGNSKRIFTFNVPKGYTAVPPRHVLAPDTHFWRPDDFFGLVVTSTYHAHNARIEQIKTEERSRGRFVFSKTNVRSPAEKARRNAIRKNKTYAKRGRPGYYHFKGTECLFNVLDIAYVPKERYTYHQKRYEKAGRPFALKQAWGFKIPGSRKCDLPNTVFSALVKIYSRPVLQEKPAIKPRASRPRNPRQRTRSDSLTRAITALRKVTETDVADIIHRPGLLARATGELSLRMRRDPSYRPDEDLYDLLVAANEYIRTKEFRNSVQRNDGYFSSQAILDEMDGVISLSKAREELSRRVRRQRVQYRTPDGQVHQWF